MTGAPYGEMMRYSNLIIEAVFKEAEDEVKVDNITHRCTGVRKMGSVEMKYVI